MLNIILKWIEENDEYYRFEQTFNYSVVIVTIVIINKHKLILQDNVVKHFCQVEQAFYSRAHISNFQKR